MNDRRRFAIIALALSTLVAGCSDDDVLVDPFRGRCPDEPVVSSTAPGIVPPVFIPSTGVLPEYPDAARVARIEGEVVLRAIIATDGEVCRTTVVTVDPPGWDFETSAADAIEQRRYEPATSGGTPIAVALTISVSYVLN